MILKLLIIEDEAGAIQHLVKLLKEISPAIEIVGINKTIQESIQWLQNHPHPDLILMDIHLSDGISFDIFEEIEVKSAIIFTTAYDQYAIQAFKTNGIDYLLKPIRKEELIVAVQKYERLRLPVSEDWLLKSMERYFVQQNEQQLYKKQFLFKQGQHLVPVKTNSIAYFYRADLVFAQCFNGTTYLTDYSLNELQKVLLPNDFIRLSRQLIVHRDAIKKLSPSKPGRLRLEVTPTFHEAIHLSQERSALLKKWLE